MMQSMLLMVAFSLGQCPVVDPWVRESIILSEPMYERCPVVITVPNGKRITVPVINGYLPAISECYCTDGSVLRTLDYRNRILYTGSNTNYVTESVARAMMKKLPGVSESSEIQQPPKIRLPTPEDMGIDKLRKPSQIPNTEKGISPNYGKK